MKKTPLEICQAGVEVLAREIIRQLHWTNIIFGTIWSIGVFILNRSSIQWLLPALLAYFAVSAFVHGTLALNVRARARKWSPPRLILALIHLSCMIITAGVALVFGAERDAACFVGAASLIAAACANEYFSDYRRNKRAVRHEFSRFRKELGMSNR